MISTITTATIVTLTTSAMVGSLALVGMALLLTMLIQKELILLSPDHRLRQFSRALNIGIVPLLITFGLICVIKVLELAP